MSFPYRCETPFERWLEAHLLRLLHNQNRMESQMSDLSNAVAKLAVSVKNEIDAVNALLNNPNPDVNNAIAQLNELSAKLDAETAVVAPPAPVEPPAAPAA